jgi:hypothetical protein
MIKNYTELSRLYTFEDRYEYLRLQGIVGKTTFGFDRWMNQRFYGSIQWRQLRNHIIARDLACDLGIEGYEIYKELVIHHMNPITADQIHHGDGDILDPEFLITTSHRTHNAIHYGDARLLPRLPIERRAGDTRLW